MMFKGKCDACGKEEVYVKRKIFTYPGIKCACCSNEHFEVRYYCNDCETIEEAPTTTVIFNTRELRQLSKSLNF